MQPSDFTFAMLAKAIAAAGGSVHVTASDLLSLNTGYMIDLTDDGRGGQILTLSERHDTIGLEGTVEKIRE